MKNSEVPKFKSPEIQQVSDRTYEQYLEFFSLPEEELKGKKILDIGSGFADFVKVVNERFAKDGTKAIGVDPVYAFFDDDFEKFEKNLLPDANLFLIFGYGKKPGSEARSMAEWKQKRGEFYSDFYQQVKNSGTYLAGSHQALPFKNESIDLIVGSNSIICLQDKKIVKHALEESLGVLKENGEIRLQPAGIRWKKNEGLFLAKSEIVTDKDRKELIATNRITDRELFNILKDLEAQGIKFYSFAVKMPSRYPGQQVEEEIVFSNIILRKDNKIPQVDEGTSDFHELRRLLFSKSDDDHHIPSEIIKTKK